MKYNSQNKKSSYYKDIDMIVHLRGKEIFDFFNSPEINLKTKVYIYNDIESLVSGLKKRGFAKDPDYMCACFKDEDNSLNFFEPKNNPSENEWSKEEYETVIFHELIHAVQYNLFGSAPEWLCEGIAKYLDGSYSKGINWLLNNRINKKSIPKQIEIEKEFGLHDYNSYDYAFLMVSYLIETLGKDAFVNLLNNPNKLSDIKNNLLENSIEYYNKKYY